jgi:hypothetical protein
MRLYESLSVFFCRAFHAPVTRRKARRCGPAGYYLL